VRFPTQGSGLLILAQLAAVVQGVLGVVVGVDIIRLDLGFAQQLGRVYPGGAHRVFVSYGVAVVILALLMIVAAVFVSRRSQLARWSLAAWEGVMLGLTLLTLLGYGLLFGFLTVLAVSVGSAAGAPVAVVIGLEVLVLYALAVHPPTYEAFAR